MKIGRFACVAIALAACAPSVPPRLPSSRLLAVEGERDVRAIVATSKLTVVTFFSATCPVQAAHDARLVALHARYAPRGVAFVAVASERDATPERVADEARRRAFPFPIMVDPGASLANALGVDTATWTVVVDADGFVRYAGGIDSDRTHLAVDATPYVADALDDLLDGRAPRLARGKSLGCTLQTR